MTEPPGPVRHDAPLLSADDLYLFNEGAHFRLHHKLGAHLAEADGKDGVSFAVWAPNAEAVSVVGDFNGWQRDTCPLRPVGASGIWQGFVPGVGEGAVYKYHIRSRQHGYAVDKADPFAFWCETPPKTASIVRSLDYQWGDQEWMAQRRSRNDGQSPIAIYECHLGSWARTEQDNGRFLTYAELAPKLAGYVRSMGYTHVELLPVMEHPFYGSWGYQTTGYFAPTSRYGTPQDFMGLVDHLHQRGVAVILDWVPSHFPRDEHSLAFFDGTHLYEHADPRRGLHPDWDSAIFNYGRNEVRSFLISSAVFWLERYHADGLRVDAVASMLYRDYSRKPGEWLPNQYGGREDLEAVDFLRRLNEEVYRSFPDVHTIAEESTAWPMVSRPTHAGGLGFGMKWDMGWMHDTLAYMARDPVHRQHHQQELSFRSAYAFHENFVLPLSHDEVVHGKGSLLAKMPGDQWQRFANLRLLLGYQYALPGKKLLFMGIDVGQTSEWQHDAGLDWGQTEQPLNAGLQRWVRDLNQLYRREPALHRLDFYPEGFEWVDTGDAQHSVLSFLRYDLSRKNAVLVVCNFTPVPRHGYRVGAPVAGLWRELLSSDASAYGGSGVGNPGSLQAESVPWHGRPCSLTLTLPPLGVLLLKAEER